MAKFTWLLENGLRCCNQFQVDGLTLSHDYDDLFAREQSTHQFWNTEQINYDRKLHEVHSSLHTIAAQFFFPFMNFNTIIYNKFRPPSYFPCGSAFISMDMVFFLSSIQFRQFLLHGGFEKCTRMAKQS